MLTTDLDENDEKIEFTGAYVYDWDNLNSAYSEAIEKDDDASFALEQDYLNYLGCYDEI